MPPANSPSSTPELDAEAASPYLRQLEAISSPVPDFAATLSTRDENSDESMSYLRTRLPESPDPTLTRTERPWRPYLTEAEFQNITSESRRRLLRTLDLSRRIPVVSSGQQDESSGSSYANRVPQRQSLYDWAPALVEENGEGDAPHYRFHLLNRSREHLPLPDQNHNRSIPRSIETQRPPRSRPRREPRDEPSGRATVSHRADSLRNDSSSPRSEQSLSATAALLQSVERHRRYNARAPRQTMQRFLLDRDRLNYEGSSPDATPSRVHRSEHTRGTSPYSNYLSHPPSFLHDPRAAYRQIFLDNPSLNRLRQMIKYLSDLRHCTTIEERECLAADLDFDTIFTALGHFKTSCLLMDLSRLKPPQPSSWLQPGTVFSGSQHSPQEIPALMTNRDRDALRRHLAAYQSSINTRWESHPEALPGSLRTPADSESYISSINQPTLSHASTSAAQALRNLDNWPVRVELHSVDLDNMTLSGTMSASHIPDKLSPASADHNPEGSSMRSYFEGEIIDFQKNTLETENFRSDGLETDVTYWRRVGPFREIAERVRAEMAKRRESTRHREEQEAEDAEAESGEVEDEIARCLANLEWIGEKLGKEWVLMRWKERCFISESDAGWGLTISGYYYIAMKRSTGQIDGLYYDPGSQPYQQLSMMPEGTRQGSSVAVKRRWPAFEFR